MQWSAIAPGIGGPCAIRDGCWEAGGTCGEREGECQTQADCRKDRHDRLEHDPSEPGLLGSSRDAVEIHWYLTELNWSTYATLSCRAPLHASAGRGHYPDLTMCELYLTRLTVGLRVPDTASGQHELAITMFSSPALPGGM